MIVPVYNTGRNLLSRCVDSLLQQTYSDLEIILVDDGSQDNSGRVCDEYAQKDRRVKAVHKENGGEASARNAGLALSSGQFVGFFDSDDECPENAVAALAERINRREVDMAVGAYLEKTGGITRIAVANRGEYTPHTAISELILSGNTYSTSYIFSTVNGKLFRSERIHERRLSFDESLKVGNDTVFMREYLACCGSIQNVFLPTYIYYKYDTQQRMQGSAWLYPDWFRFLCEVRKREVDIIRKAPSSSEGELHAIYQKTMDELIGSLVIAAAYASVFPDGLEKPLAEFIQTDLVTQAVKYYQPRRISDSMRIPKCILEKDLAGLMDALEGRAAEYIQSHGRTNHVRLIYSERSGRVGLYPNPSGLCPEPTTL